MRASLLVLGAAGLAACGGNGQTGIIVEIRSDLAVPAELDRVVIRASSGGPNRVERPLDLGTGPGRVELPLRAAFIQVDEAPRLDVEITGLLAGKDVIRRASTLAYVKGRTVTVTLHLTRACAGVICPAGLVCIPSREACGWPSEDLAGPGETAQSESPRPRHWIDRTPSVRPPDWAWPSATQFGVTLTYDPGGKQVYLLGGGKVENGQFSGPELMAWDGATATWKARAKPPGSFSSRLFHTGARGTLVMPESGGGGGGGGGGPVGAGVEEYDPAKDRWNHIVGAGEAPATLFPGFPSPMAYDPVRERMLLFGVPVKDGRARGPMWQQLLLAWELATRFWQELDAKIPEGLLGGPTGTPPATAALWDSDRNFLLLLGERELWELDPSQWAWRRMPVTLESEPQGSSASGKAEAQSDGLSFVTVSTTYHARRRSIMALQGDGRLWEGSIETGNWIAHAPVNRKDPSSGQSGPPSRESSGAMTYDSGRDRLVAFIDGHLFEWVDGPPGREPTPARPDAGVTDASTQGRRDGGPPVPAPPERGGVKGGAGPPPATGGEIGGSGAAPPPPDGAGGVSGTGPPPLGGAGAAGAGGPTPPPGTGMGSGTGPPPPRPVMIGDGPPCFAASPAPGEPPTPRADSYPWGNPNRISRPELAQRLANLLWREAPDQALLDRVSGCATVSLSDVELLVGEMLDDPRALAGQRAFFTQWLQLARLPTLTRDPRVFPGWNATVAAAMAEEIVRFGAHVALDEKGTLTDLLTASFTFVNRTAAGVYGLDPSGLDDTTWRRVALPDAQRRAGLLTRPGFLTLAGASDRNSPAARGFLISQSILCRPSPQSPPGAPTSADLKRQPGQSVRSALEASLVDPTCQSCHALLAPGFAFEMFDATGRFRTSDDGAPIDATGRLLGAGGGVFDGPVQLATLLASSPDSRRCFARNWLNFARVPFSPMSEPLLARFEASNLRIRALIAAVAMTQPFLAPP